MSPEQALHAGGPGEMGEKLTKNADKERISNKEGLWRVGGALEVGIRVSPRQEGSCLPLHRGERPRKLGDPLRWY